MISSHNISLPYKHRSSAPGAVYLPNGIESGKPIPDDIIWQLLENANWAPTHKFTEPWRFTVFSGEGAILRHNNRPLYKEFAGPKFKQGKYEQLQTSSLASMSLPLG